MRAQFSQLPLQRFDPCGQGGKVRGDLSFLGWLLLLLVFGRIYATPLDSITRLDRRRQIIAVITLIAFVLVFMPVPLQEYTVGILR